MSFRRSFVPVAALVGLLVAAAPAVAASPSGVVISKLRTRTAASPYDEYVEIRNTSAAAVDLSGWRLYDCYQSGGTQRIGADGDPLPAGTTLPAGATFVFGKDRGDYTGTADAIYGYQVTESGGFQLRDDGGTVQDGVGAPGTACAEGTGLSFPTSGDDFTFTRSGPDTDDNAADFAGPSGSADGTACGEPCKPVPVQAAIDQVQGDGNTTPMSGRDVTITGVVVGVDSQQGVSNYVNLDPRQAGIYVQAPTPQDDDPSTSEGIFVGGLSAADRAASHIGDLVTVTGKAGELYNLTWVDASGNQPLFSGPAQLPAPVPIDPARAASQTVYSNGTRSYYESLEGMRVRLAVGTADSGGTDKFGELFLRPGTERRRVFRDPQHTTGPADLLNAGQDAGSADVDPANPSATPPSSTRVDADLFDRVRGLVGPLGFAFSQYQVQPQPGAMPTVRPGPIHYPPFVPRAPRHSLRVANFNVENLFAAGMVDDNHTFTRAEVDAKTTRIADAIRILRRPDVIAVEEVADPAPLREVARKAGRYRAIWRPSTDARHIAVGFLVRRGVQARDVRQLGRDATTTAEDCNDNGTGHKTFERPPLAVDVKRGPIRFTIIGNHWASQGHPEPCRQAQAAFLHDQAAQLEAAGRQVVVLGDLNDFEDSPALTQDLVAPGTTLRNLWSRAPRSNRYSYQYSGQLQTLDHIFMTRGLRRDVTNFRYVHFDNDYHERDPLHDAAKVSDHDSPLATLTW